MSDPASQTTDGTALDGSRLAMLSWLMSADARSAAASELHGLGLSFYDPDDLLNDVAVRLFQSMTVPDNPVAYARRAVTTRAIDLLRGERVRRDRTAPLLLDDDEVRTVPDLADDDAGPSDVVALAAAEDGIRRRLHVVLAGTAKVWTVAAALTTLTLRVHRDVALPDAAPRPTGDDEGKADRWAALWLAGETDVFPDPEAGRHDDPARRQARSRKLRDVSQLLHEMAASILGGGDDA